MLQAGSEGSYGDEMWAVNDFDAITAGAWRIGRGAGRLFDQGRGDHVLAVLDVPNRHELLARHMNSILAAELLRAYRGGFRTGRYGG